MVGGDCMVAKKMTWEEMVMTYPDAWVVLKNVKKSGPDIISGDVIDVVDDNEIMDYEDEHDGEGLTFRRTTEGEWNGTISANFIIETI